MNVLQIIKIMLTYCSGQQNDLINDAISANDDLTYDIRDKGDVLQRQHVIIKVAILPINTHTQCNSNNTLIMPSYL